MLKKIQKALEEYKVEHAVATKGKLSQILVISHRAREISFPVSHERLLTARGGQIAGASGTAANKILKAHGIHRKLSAEGGRTSRGAIKYVREYLNLLNKLHAAGLFGAGGEDPTLLDIEIFWIERIKDYFNCSPLEASIDLSCSVGQIVSSVLQSATARQRDLDGATIVGTVLQHLVGAKLDMALEKVQFEHHCAAASDSQQNRSGDFLIKDAVIHVTNSPGEAVIARCAENLKGNYRPIVVCPSDKVAAARQLSEIAGLAARIEVFDAQAFISMNLNEISLGGSESLATTTSRFIEKYNELILKHEGDPSLCIKTK